MTFVYSLFSDKSPDTSEDPFLSPFTPIECLVCS